MKSRLAYLLLILSFLGLKTFVVSSTTKCKYILIDKTFYNKYQSSQSSLLYKITQITTGRVELTQNYVKYSIDDCYNTELNIDLLESIQSNKTILYGIDLSSNQLNDTQFENILNTNPIFKHNINNIRYLNLSDNQLNKLTTDSSVYLLSRFNDLEILILDKNPKLSLNNNDLNFLYNLVKNKLKIISLNKCNLNENSLATNTSYDLNIDTKLIYLGLNGNKIGDLIKLEQLVKLSGSIEQLDLSFNKIGTIPNFLFESKIYKLNLEKNLIDSFNINDVHLNPNITSLEINLKSNFIRNTSLNNYKLTKQKNTKVSIKLLGNPLVCDCNSMWLLDQSKKQASQVTFRSFMNKKLKSKREIEELSYHNIENDPNFNDSFMQRQKRLKSSSTTTTTLPIGQNSNKIEDDVIRILDLEIISCNYIDVQNFQSKNSTLYEETDLEFDQELRKQNIQVNSIKYKEKLIIASTYQDYMCSYEDHCKPDECDCCMFQHCHCRSICPSKCRCYFDSKLEQNIIDCSDLNLMDIPNQVPIESATDIRLNSNSLKIVKPHSFFGYGQLKFLYLQNNQISYLTSDAFDDLKYSLKLLNLANNHLTYLNGDEFNSLSELNVLVLNKNPIKDIDNIYFIDFKYLPNLRLIFMSDTNLNDAKMNELVKYSQTNTNATVKYRPKIEETTLALTSTSSVATETISIVLSSIQPSTSTPKDELIDFIDLILLEQQKQSTTTKLPELVTHKEEDVVEDFILLTSTKSINSEDQQDELLIINPSLNNNNLDVNDDLLINIKHDSTDFETSISNPDKNKTGFFFFSKNYELVNLLRWYYFPILVFSICLITSIVLVIIVILLARKFDVKPNPSNKKRKTRVCFCFPSFSNKNKNSSTCSSSYFTTPSNNLNEDDLDSCESGDESDSETGSTPSNQSLLRKLVSCFKKSSHGKPTETFKPCHRSNSFDSSSMDYGGYDSASVPVSRSIQNLNLNVFIYYNIHDESYVLNYLLPLLKKCLVIIPDTKYITKPQATKYITVGPVSFFENSNNKQNESIYLDSQTTMLNKNFFSNGSNCLISNILIISDNFHGYKPLNESFMSIRLNNSNKSSNSSLIYTNNNNYYLSKKSSNQQQQRMLDSVFKNSFKIYINLNKYDISANNNSNCSNKTNSIKNNNSSKTQSLNQGLLRKIYDNYATKINSTSSSSSSSTSSSTVSSTINNSSCNTNNRNSILISNDSNSSFGFNDKLQFKLEKHFESVCLKSNTLFSKTNFSYVDYTKR